MDVRFEVLKLRGVWTLSNSGPEIKSFATRSAAITAGITAACVHHDANGGEATVHVWENDREEVVFDTRGGFDQAAKRIGLVD